MKTSVPEIKFLYKDGRSHGLDIISMTHIADQKSTLNHNPEKAHRVTFYTILYFTEGHGKHFVDFNWYDVQAGTLIYLKANQVHAFQFNKNLNGYCILLTESNFIQSLAHIEHQLDYRIFNPEIFSPVLHPSNLKQVDFYFNLLRQELFETKNQNKKIVLGSLVQIFMAKVFADQANQLSANRNSPTFILFRQFIGLVEKQYMQTRNAQDYAKKLSVTYKHLNDISKSFVQKTAKQLIDDFVILQAKRALINSSITSTSLAYELGFDTPTNFSKYFKKRCGYTPGEFQRGN